ncbi:MAG TPA: hypothetical protein VKD90_08340 [Gemmataceae bacterium]|nr:hypothetical protein [Gemmataceae bacterium]
MHCSRCGREFKFDLDQFAKGCSKCNDSDLIPTDQSIAVIGREPSPFFRTFAWLMVELVGVMAAILFVTRKRNVSEDADYVYMRCEKCRQKIRYRERQVGNTAHCPRCKRQFAYPEVDGE